MTIDIYGSFIDGECERECEDDISPNIFKDTISALEDGEELVIRMNSCGGNCTSGIAIANMIKGLKSRGIKTKCIIEGVCCSIASVVAMACDEIEMYESSFIMIHNPWTMIHGDADTLRKEATSLDAMKKAIMSFYHMKFNLTDEQIEKYMDEETWISGSSAKDYKLDVTVLEDINDFKIAAKYVEVIDQKFNNITLFRNTIKMEKEIKIDEVTEEVKVEPVTEETKDECGCEEKKDETVVEEVKEEVEEKMPTVEELEAVIEELKKKIEELESQKDMSAEERVSGMQSKMQNKLNAQHKEFTDKLEFKEKELSEMKNQVSALVNELETTKKEFSEMKSAFEEKETALAKLNANVLSPNEDKEAWKNLKGKAFFDWIKNNNIR